MRVHLTLELFSPSLHFHYRSFLTTTTSADFCTSSSTSRYWLLFSEHTVQTSPGTHTFFFSVHLPYLPCMIPCSYWDFDLSCSLTLMQSLICFPFVRPEICLHLPSDSASRQTPLVFGYILPATGQIRDFHPLERAPAGRT